MQIKRYKILDFSEVTKVYNKKGRVSYYFLDVVLEDREDEDQIRIISKVVYTWWELRKLKKLKYLHILEESAEAENEEN